MSNKRDDGGPAFPRSAVIVDGMIESDAQSGMSLRDWFAGQAMERFKFGGYARSWKEATRAAEAAYRIADSMLAARGLTGEELSSRAFKDVTEPEWREQS